MTYEQGPKKQLTVLNIPIFWRDKYGRRDTLPFTWEVQTVPYLAVLGRNTEYTTVFDRNFYEKSARNN